MDIGMKIRRLMRAERDNMREIANLWSAALDIT